MKKSSEPKVMAIPFLVGDDGRIYISRALIQQSAITKAQLKA